MSAAIGSWIYLFHVATNEFWRGLQN